jgi:hypothetical protein
MKRRDDENGTPGIALSPELAKEMKALDKEAREKLEHAKVLRALSLLLSPSTTKTIRNGDHQQRSWHFEINKVSIDITTELIE